MTGPSETPVAAGPGASPTPAGPAPAAPATPTQPAPRKPEVVGEGWARSPDLTASIPWRQRLTTKLLAATAALAVAGVVVFAITENRFHAAMLEQMASGSELFSQTIDRATTKAMLADHREEAYDTMRAIGAQPGIEKVRMFNKLGRVTFSTDPAEAGNVVPKKAEACAPCHSSDRAPAEIPTALRTRVFRSERGHRVMGLLRPIFNEPRCSSAACHEHASADRVLGVLDVGVSLEDVDQRIGIFRLGSVLFTAAGVLLLGGFFLVLARRHVVRPVFALVEATRRVSHDERDVEIHVDSQGELGLLAAAFNDMTRSLRRAEGDLRELNRNLEQKVAAEAEALRRAQAKLIQSEKLSSLGQLSASIAHEINNPLAGILTFAKLLIRDAANAVPDEEKRKAVVKNLSLVQRETERCSAIVRNLLDFARERPLELKDIDLNVVVNESIQLIGHQVEMQGQSLDKRLLPLPAVHGDFGQLRQAIVNVALNASEAMGRGGKLSIVSAAVEDGRWAEVVIADTGPGIAPENLSRIFDPFFTTKEKGTGLGLSVVYGIVQRHGGTVDVKSEVGKGATFTFRLPAARPAGG